MVSVIIPCYNSENTIVRSLKSVLISDLIILEVIVVDDGSTDESARKVVEIANDNPQVRLIRQDNKGLGGARNTGLEAANGKYVLFLDSDDWFITDVLSSLIEVLEKDNIQILEFSALNVDWKAKKTIIPGCLNTQTMNGLDYFEKKKYLYSACNKLYERSFLVAHDLRFKEGVYFEDVEFNLRAYYFAHRVKGFAITAACFYIRPLSITRDDSFVGLTRKLIDFEKLLEYLVEFKNEDSNLKVTSFKLERVIDREMALIRLRILYYSLRLSRNRRELFASLSKLRRKGLFPFYHNQFKWKEQIFYAISSSKFGIQLLWNLMRLK